MARSRLRHPGSHRTRAARRQADPRRPAGNVLRNAAPDFHSGLHSRRTSWCSTMWCSTTARDAPETERSDERRDFLDGPARALSGRRSRDDPGRRSRQSGCAAGSRTARRRTGSSSRNYRRSPSPKHDPDATPAARVMSHSARRSIATLHAPARSGRRPETTCPQPLAV